MKDTHLWTYWIARQEITCNCGWKAGDLNKAEAINRHGIHAAAAETQWQFDHESAKITLPPYPEQFPSYAK